MCQLVGYWLILCAATKPEDDLKYIIIMIVTYGHDVGRSIDYLFLEFNICPPIYQRTKLAVSVYLTANLTIPHLMYMDNFLIFRITVSAHAFIRPRTFTVTTVQSPTHTVGVQRELGLNSLTKSCVFCRSFGIAFVINRH